MPSLARRAFVRHLASAGGLAMAPAAAFAQIDELVPGRDYIQVSRPVSLPDSGKIEVADFFWYGCPHCFAFEPSVAAWSAQVPADIRFRRVPYGFDDPRREVHQRIFCTLEALDLVETMHAKVFERFHRQHRPIDSEADMLDFAADNGLAVASVKSAWNGFTVQKKMRQAKDLCDAYGVDAVPLVGIQGRYLTRPRNDQDGARALAVTDILINLVRKGG